MGISAPPECVNYGAENVILCDAMVGKRGEGGIVSLQVHQQETNVSKEFGEMFCVLLTCSVIFSKPLRMDNSLLLTTLSMYWLCLLHFYQELIRH